MTTRTLKILGAAAVVALLLAWWLTRPAADPAQSGGKAESVLPGYREKINDISRVELDDGEKPLTVEKRGAEWVDVRRGGYPVKAEEVKGLLLALNGLERKEAKTDKPALHGELQLAVDGDPEQRGKVLRLWTAGSEQPAWELVVGKAKWTPVRGLYVRLLSDNQCWFATGELQLPYSPTAWFEKEIVNVNQLDVAKVVLVRGAETFTITRPDSDTPWTLAELPEGRALKESSPFGSLANTLGFLNFDDVAPATEERFARDPDLVAEFTCFNGASVRGIGWKEGEKMWMRFEASPPTVEPPPADPEAELGPEDGPQEGPRGPSSATIAGWSGRFTGWCYEMSPWKAQALQQPLEDWLEPLPGAEDAEAGAEAGAGGGDGEQAPAPAPADEHPDDHEHPDDQK